MRQRPPPVNLCLVRGCNAAIPRWKRLCDAHFKQLPWARRRALADAPRHLVQDRALEAAAWLEDCGPAAQAARMMGERDDEDSGGSIRRSAADG